MQMGVFPLALVALTTIVSALQPTSKWHLDYGNDACRITRDFGTSAKPIVIDFEAPPMGHGLNVNFFDSRIAVEHGKSSIRVQLVPDPAVLQLDSFTASVGDHAVSKMSFTLDEESLQKIAGANVISIERRDNRPVVLNLPGLRGAMSALENCRANLVTAWGMPLTEQSRLKTPPTVDPKLAKHGLFSTDDYPTSALRANIQGATTVRIDVEADGRPSQCTVVRSSGDAALDATTCNVVMKRARYVAASAQDGRPMKSIDVVKIQWIIPSERSTSTLAPRPALENTPAPLSPQ